MSSFKVNEYLTIKKFKIVGSEIVQFMKFGQLEDYKKFVGEIENKKVKGYICLKDDNIYQLKEVLK